MNTGTRQLDLTPAQSTERVIEEWVEHAKSAKSCEQRQYERYPFFRPVKVSIGTPVEMEICAFSSDISLAGIGLFHHMRLPLQEVVLATETIGGLFVSLQAKIEWTKPLGDGWYRSGLRAAGISATQALALLAEVFSTELRGRWHQRYPFFYPATLTIGGRRQITMSSLSRDISYSGISLIHDVDVNAVHANVRINTNACNGTSVPLDFVWSKPCGSGLFLSGWQFWQPHMIELEPYCP